MASLDGGAACAFLQPHHFDPTIGVCPLCGPLSDNATVSQGVKLCTASHDISSKIMELTYEPITIGANAWVAGWSIILPGVTIGEGAVVAAGAVVTKDVEPWTVVGGNPAKLIKKRELKEG